MNLQTNKQTENGNTYKGIGGVGRLSQKAIKAIQGHYGGAIRGNVGDIYAMNKQIWSIWRHRRTDHSLCSQTCPANGEADLERANKRALPKHVLEAIKPIFEDLIDDSLLKTVFMVARKIPTSHFIT